MTIQHGDFNNIFHVISDATGDDVTAFSLGFAHDAFGSNKNETLIPTETNSLWKLLVSVSDISYLH